MKVQWCAAALLLVAACSPSERPVLFPRNHDTPRYLLVKTNDAGRAVIRRVPIEEYVRGAILAEFAPSSGDGATVERMLEVQAVVSRSYALAHAGRHSREGFDLCSTTHCQLYDAARLRTSRWTDAAAGAARKTAGLILVYRGAPADTLFHADCGGRTSAAVAVWGGTGRPYLRSAFDDGPARAAHGTWSFEVGRDTLVRALNTDPRTRVGERLDAIKVQDRDEAGRVGRVTLLGRYQVVTKGEALRDVLSRTLGPLTVRSTWFTVERNGSTFVFTGQGFGHGVGLCQVGALARVQAGEKLGAILQHYFPGTKLVVVG